MPHAWIDATMPIHPGMPAWPGQPSVEVSLLEALDEPNGCDVSVLRTSVHTGTHMDAFSHFLVGGEDIAHMPADRGIGRVRVVAVRGEPHVCADDVQWIDDQRRIDAGDRLIFKTRNSDRDWNVEPFDEGYAAIAPDAAGYLADRGVGFVGVDYLSVAPFDDAASTHHILLQAGVCVVEGLRLQHVDPGDHEMIALPLKIQGADAAPTRVLLRAL
ncbi:cyclase family protein [Phycisphaera mikurensis]|uniref:Kynurenine formamidase n=1 Tax=Phycisphaera mikurensis (strain NBRC 102666 / KCTC 22515 / FYK2301M01) TaxID=1142394 RepID=I0IGF3_PHYMF|nr:cyclase family protein [Phycisphaera mikurensis]MBB6440281.1 arylformamidase [Phycisphaera mikurensis]BAM04341.1 cyclase family protein [Phycisphaera mikurensis NBRC 102666]